MNNNVMVIGGVPYKTGCEVLCRIDGNKTKGKLFIPSGGCEDYGYFFICQDFHDGAECEDTLGYKYSYAIKMNERSLNAYEVVKINNNVMDDIISLAFPIKG